MAQKDKNPLDYPRYVRGLRPALAESLPYYVEDELEKLQNSLDGAAKAAFDEVEAARAEIEDTNAKVDKIGEDEFLHPAEKLIVVREWADITRVYQNADARAAALGITTERTAATSAYNALSAYLGSLVPAWNDTNQVTAIVRTTWNANWDAVFSTLEALWVRISVEDANRATWGNVSGSGKPQDNATVGAQIGTNLSGQFNSGNVGTYFASATFGNAHIAGVIQSDNYSPGTAGWKIDKSGATLAEFNGVVLSRDQVLASGNANFGYHNIIAAGASGVPPQELFLDDGAGNAMPFDRWVDTGVLIAPWFDNYGPLAANAVISSSPSVPFSPIDRTADAAWTVVCDVVPVTRFSGAATIWIRMKFYGLWIEEFNPLTVTWWLYKVR